MAANDYYLTIDEAIEAMGDQKETAYVMPDGGIHIGSPTRMSANSVEEAVEMLDRQFGYSKTATEMMEMDYAATEQRVATWMQEQMSKQCDESLFQRLYMSTFTHTDPPKDTTFQWTKLQDPNTWVCEGAPLPLVNTKEEIIDDDPPSEYAQISHLLPDLYGRAEHAAYMERAKEQEACRQEERADELRGKLSALMDGLCGEER